MSTRPVSSLRIVRVLVAWTDGNANHRMRAKLLKRTPADALTALFSATPAEMRQADRAQRRQRRRDALGRLMDEFARCFG